MEKKLGAKIAPVQFCTGAGATPIYRVALAPLVLHHLFLHHLFAPVKN